MRLPIQFTFAAAALLCLAAPVSGGAKTSNARAAVAATRGAKERCGAGKDLVVQALERMNTTSSADQLVDATELLKRAADLCANSGDAWYYRALVEKKLGHAPIAAFALRQAKLFDSEALEEGRDPFVLSTPPKGPLQPLPHVRERWALVVGIGTFADRSIQHLRYPASDATAFHDVLVDPKLGGFKPENVRLLTDDGATLSDIKKGLNWLARSASPDDLVVVYVASHGSSRSADTAGASYIITHDTELGEKIDPDSLYASAFPMVELSNDVATRLRALRTAVFLDTCYSGGAISNSKAATGLPMNASISKATLKHISQGSGRVIFAASQTDQESLESPTLAHGYFTYYLVEALKQNASMPLSKVFDYVQAHVSQQVTKDYALYGLHQTPVMSRSADDTDFSLGAGEAGGVATVAAR